MLNETVQSGTSIDALDTPAVVVDLDRLERNVQAMAERARAAGVALRPHVKSHKTVEIARRQLGAGAAGITVAKLDEAEAYLDVGVADIFVANEVAGPTKWARAAALQERGSVALGVDSLDAARGLAAAAGTRAVTIPVLIEVDSGLHRAGLSPTDAVADLAQAIVALDHLDLRGVFTHAGHAYAAHGVDEVRAIARAEAGDASLAAELIRARRIPCPVVSIGSTPTICAAGVQPGVTEIRPGNYVFFDRMQVALGAATPDQCALSVLATVISRPAADRLVVDAGSKTFALDRGAHGLEALAGFGEDAEHGLVLSRLSEEHGVLQADGTSVAVGDRLRFSVNHACTVANLAATLIGVRADRVAEVMPVLVRGGGR
ncbi:MAG: alanine racemase [Chloroflexi bacterium]|nr:alanine racemase [Chloroflexota bacterium]